MAFLKVKREHSRDDIPVAIVKMVERFFNPKKMMCN
jgi:hypothetical protein